jgi:acetyl esterase/lipase
MRASRVATILAIAAILAISLYSADTIAGVINSNSPYAVTFTLGTAYQNLTYCNSQTLDLYVPNGTATLPLPLVVYVHGGGLTAGDKEDINPVFLNSLASAGYAVASVNYRLAPQFKYPAQIEDVKCAMRYLRDHAQAYGINSSEVFAFGTSSGGELVALAALTGSHSPFDVGPYLNESSSVVAVVDMFGPTNLTANSGYSSSDLMRAFGDNLANEVLASPVHFVTRNSPPILIIQGVNDTNVPESQSIQLYNALRGSGDQTQLILVQNMGHMFVQVGSQPINPSLAQISQDMLSFFKLYTHGGG